MPGSVFDFLAVETGTGTAIQLTDLGRTVVVPEPGAGGLLAAGLLALDGLARARAPGRCA